MNKVQKQRKIKRPSVIIKRIHFPRNIKKVKSHSPLYQKLKVNNNSLAKALSLEKQESQNLFSRNVELLSEVHELVHNCNVRDEIITNVLAISKNMMPTVTKLTESLVKIISVCQTYSSNQRNSIRNSSSSASRRESIQRLSTKSPAKGVVKPMVSGHTITKPTINLSRVNMQRLPNTNLSIINESISNSLSERSLNLSSNDRRSRSQSLNSRSSVSDTEETVSNSNSRRSTRFSGRYSKRNSSRLSSGLHHLNRTSDQNNITKSPRVTLNDVSKLMRNSQSVNLRLLQEASNHINESNDEETSMECDDTNVPLDNQEASENSDASLSNVEQQRASVNDSTAGKSSQIIQNTTQNQSSFDLIDPREGPSWLCDDMSFTCPVNNGVTINQNLNNSSKKRKKNIYFTDSPLKKYSTSSLSNQTPKNNSDLVNTSLKSNSGADAGDSENIQNNLSDDDGRTINFRNFVTQRRGTNTKTASVIVDDDDDDESDDYTLMMNMKKQMAPSQKKHFDVNELLKMTPYKPLLNMKLVNSEQQERLEPSEFTSTVQITNKVNRKNLENDFEKSTILLAPRVNSHERNNDIHDATTVELPRVSDIQLDSPANFKEEKRKRRKPIRQLSDSLSMSDSEEKPIEKKKLKQKKKKVKSKDPSLAKVVLTKLNKPNGLSDSLANSEEKRNSSLNNETVDSISTSLAQQKEHSDSESSNASTCSKNLSSRPRRQKAPTTLKEPLLKKKLRRDK